MWPLRKLKDLCHIEKGATGIMKAVPGPYPMVGIAEERRTHTSYQFDAAAVIIPLVSSTGHGHASLKRIHYQEGKFALGSILCALIPKDPTQLDPLYLYHYLDVYKEQLFVPLMKGMANVSLSMTSIGEVEVPLPTKAEQDEWVQKFEWVNEQQETLTTELDHQRTLLKQLRQAILQEAVQGKLTAAWRTSHPELISGKNHASVLLERIGTEKEALVKAGKLRKPKPLPPIKPEEVPFALPEGWVWCRLGEVITFLNGYAFESHKFSETGVRLVRNVNVGHGTIAWDDVARYPERELVSLDRFKLEAGDLVVSLDRPIIATGLKVALIREVDLPSMLLQRVACIRERSAVNVEYIYRWMLSDEFMGRINPGRSMGVPHISTTQLEQLYFPLPGDHEQGVSGKSEYTKFTNKWPT